MVKLGTVCPAHGQIRCQSEPTATMRLCDLAPNGHLVNELQLSYQGSTLVTYNPLHNPSYFHLTLPS
jgi:hypothetical protein